MLQFSAQQGITKQEVPGITYSGTHMVQLPHVIMVMEHRTLNTTWDA